MTPDQPLLKDEDNNSKNSSESIGDSQSNAGVWALDKKLTPSPSVKCESEDVWVYFNVQVTCWMFMLNTEKSLNSEVCVWKERKPYMFRNHILKTLVVPAWYEMTPSNSSPHSFVWCSKTTFHEGIRLGVVCTYLILSLMMLCRALISSIFVKLGRLPPKAWQNLLDSSQERFLLSLSSWNTWQGETTIYNNQVNIRNEAAHWQTVKKSDSAVRSGHLEETET